MNDYGKIAYEVFCDIYQPDLPISVPYETLDLEYRLAWETAIDAAFNEKLKEAEMKKMIGSKSWNST